MSARAYARDYTPGDVLSPSQGKTFLNCSARWAFKHICRLPDPKAGQMLMGAAVHAATAENFRQKLETHRDLDDAGAIALYRDAWAAERPVTEFRDDEDEDQLKRQGEGLVRHYLEHAAPRITPAAVELPVTGLVSGVRVKGYVDLLDVDGRIIDLKCKGKKPRAAGFDEVFQVATYRRLAPQATGAGRVDVLVKNKKPDLVQLEFNVTASDLVMVDRLYPQVQAAIRGQIFTPNRASHLCSRRYCAFWRACQKEFGGTVPA